MPVCNLWIELHLPRPREKGAAKAKEGEAYLTCLEAQTVFVDLWGTSALVIL